MVDYDELLPTLKPILNHWRDERDSDEGFGDFCHRVGFDALRALTPAAAAD